MQSTPDWMDEMSTKFQMESNSSEDFITLKMQRRLKINQVPFQAGVLTVGVLGILANLLVLFGFWLAGRSKMNVSSAYIANHTTLERQTFSWTFKSVISDQSTSLLLTPCQLTSSRRRPIVSLLRVGFLL